MSTVLKTPPVEVLHHFPKHTSSTLGYWVQVRHHKTHAAAARAAADRLALINGLNPQGRVRQDITSESKRLRTVELWYSEALSLLDLVSLSVELASSEQELIRFNQEHLEKMRCQRAEYEATESPLFAQAGALEEVSRGHYRNPLAWMFGHYESEMHGEVNEASWVQKAAQYRQEAWRELGPGLFERLDEYAVIARHLQSPGSAANYWHNALRDPATAIEELRKRDLLAAIVAERDRTGIQPTPDQLRGIFGEGG